MQALILQAKLLYAEIRAWFTRLLYAMECTQLYEGRAHETALQPRDHDE